MKRILTVILLIATVLCMASCSKMDSSDVRKIAQPLIEDSVKLNIILVGKGLPTSESEKNGKYVKVESSDYTCVEDIKRMLSAVYTMEQAQIMQNIALKGSSSEHGTIYARYIDIDGKLYMHSEADVSVPHPRMYDYDSIRTKSSTDLRIIFTIDSYSADADGNYSTTPENIELKLIFDEAYMEWRLDTPTY